MMAFWPLKINGFSGGLAAAQLLSFLVNVERRTRLAMVVTIQVTGSLKKKRKFSQAQATNHNPSNAIFSIYSSFLF